MKPLIIDSAAAVRAQALRAWVLEHRETAERITLRREGKLPPPGDLDSNTMLFPIGWRLVLSLDEIREVGWYWHVSVSVAGAKLPAFEGVNVLLALLKLPPIKDAITGWDEHGAINILFEFKGDLPQVITE